MYNVTEIAQAAQAGNGFAASLLADFNRYGGLTRRQAEAAAKGFGNRAAHPSGAAAWPTQGEPQAARPRPVAGRFAPLLAAFDTALAAGVQQPKLRLGDFKFKRVGDRVYVYLGPVYIGCFTADAFYAKQAHRDTITKVEALAVDPKAAAIQHGKLTGSCSVCSRTLTDPESVARGIGPVCAERMGWAA